MFHHLIGGWALLAVLAAPSALAADIAASGNWSPSVDATDLLTGAGSDLSPEQQSATAEIILDLTNLVSASDAWRVDISRDDLGWDPDVHLWVTRTSTGSGPGTITGGSSWVELTGVTRSFFSGTGDRAGIGLQLRITGLSISTLPPSSYASSVTYTLVDVP